MIFRVIYVEWKQKPLACFRIFIDDLQVLYTSGLFGFETDFSTSNYIFLVVYSESIVCFSFLNFPIYDMSLDTVPKELRNLRACLLCSLIKVVILVVICLRCNSAFYGVCKQCLSSKCLYTRPAVCIGSSGTCTRPMFWSTSLLTYCAVG